MGTTRYSDAELAIIRHVGKEVRRLRRSRGWNQAELGALVGESFQVVQKWETAATAISVPQLCRLAQAFGISPAMLVPLEFVPKGALG